MSGSHRLIHQTDTKPRAVARRILPAPRVTPTRRVVPATRRAQRAAAGADSKPADTTVKLPLPLARALENTETLARRYPRGVAAAVVIGLGGFAATAFGIAPLAAEVELPPQRLVSETVVPEGIAAQLEALAEHELELSRNDLTRSADTADSLFKRLGVVDAAAAEFIRRDATARALLEGRAGKMVQVSTRDDGTLVQLVARYPAERSEQAGTHFTRLTIERAGDGWQARRETAPLASEVKLGSGTIRSSLFAASDAARLPDVVAIQLAEMFAADIDFRRDLRRGDTFSVVYEALTADGEPITWNQATGRVLAAEFVNGSDTHQAVWFRDATSGRGAYYGFDGQSKRRAFLASPLEFSRVTSGFAMRMHPILNTWRQHKGVDYAAPTGTPVRTVGDGVVDFAGWQNGYGNVIEVRHSGGRSTLYAHLSRIDVKRGDRVEQGQNIGAVGSTGWSTGPHLHFEVKLNGEQRDPIAMAKASEAIALAPASRAAFAEQAAGYKARIEVARSLAGVPGGLGE
jgi:murein DD-endopeptidase MepM/ murein hydrolase activator NlpD